jgi:O-glycosyl hydrolase
VLPTGHTFVLLRWAIGVTISLGVALPCDAQPGEVTVTIDATRIEQTIEGFGASLISTYQGSQDTLSRDEKRLAAEPLLKALRINLGNADYYVLEERGNDNDDPFTIDWSGFQTFPGGLLRAKYAGRVKPAQVHGFYPAKINVKRCAWLKELRTTNYERYLDEIAEAVLAWVQAWQRDWGSPPRLAMPFNEPTSGNKELDRPAGADADREMADILKRAGKRLRDSGYGEVQFVFPNQETIDATRSTVEHVLADPEARQYVGRIGYHEYPYGSPMSAVKKVLARADKDGAYGVVESRIALKEVARSYGIPLWMTEVSHAGVGYLANGVERDIRDFRLLRGRANHIHEEFVIAGASAFFGMNDVWSRRAHELHYKGRGGGDGEGAFNASDDLVLVDQKYGLVSISSMGYAIGHYSRWITPGKTVRLESASTEPRLRATAFRDRSLNRYVLVLINNTGRPQGLEIRLKGGTFNGWMDGEQSTESAYWQELRPSRPQGADSIHIALPPFSVTTLADRASRRAPGTAPAVAAAPDQELPAGAATATLAGSVRNANGKLRWHSWVLESGPAPVRIENRTSARTTVSGLQAGAYVFRLYAVDKEWRMGSATTRIRVADPRGKQAQALKEQTIRRTV